MTPCSTPRQSTQVIIPHELLVEVEEEEGEKKKKKSGAGSVMLSMYLTSVPVRVFTETEGEE